MIIDAHIHIFPDEVVKNREKFFAGEPEFKNLYDNPKARLATAQNALDMLAQNEMTAAVVCGFPWRQAAHYTMHNDCLADLRVKYPQKFAALGAFYIQSPQAPAEALRCLELGLNGLGELAFYHDPLGAEALEFLGPIMAPYAAAGLPVMLHANEPVGHYYPGKARAEISAYYAFCKQFSQNKIILAHLGGGLVFFKLLKREVKEALQNVWFDTAAVPFLYDDHIYEICAATGYDRILFGTDFPLLGPGRYLNAINAGALSPQARRAILGENAKNLFNFTAV